MQNRSGQSTAPVVQVEMARRLYFRLWMCFQASMNMHKGNFRRHTGGRRAVPLDVKVDSVIEASKRFKLVQIESRDAARLIRELDSPDTLFYLDPPYIFDTRTTKKAYSHEMTDADHQAFAELLYEVKGYVILSGYPSPLYEELFEKKGWRRVDKEAVTLTGTKRTECLWLSPSTPLPST